MCPSPLASECAPNSIRVKRSSCSGCVAPSLIVEVGCHHGSKDIADPAAALATLTLSKALVLLETLVTAFKLPGYCGRKSSVGSWKARGPCYGCSSARISCSFRGRVIMQYGPYGFVLSAWR